MLLDLYNNQELEFSEVFKVAKKLVKAKDFVTFTELGRFVLNRFGQNEFDQMIDLLKNVYDSTYFDCTGTEKHA